MVDTINPNTNEPDQPINNRFYGGFDKPDEVKINLAESGSSPVATPVSSQPSPQPTSQPVAPQPAQDVAPVAAAEVKHSSYVNTANMINWRGVLVIGAIGLLATLVVGCGIYFGTSYLNKSKLAEQQSTLDNMKNELSALQETPTPLTLPETAVTLEPVETPAPVVEAPVVVPTPVETPQVTTPVLEDDGSKQSAG